MHHNSYSYQTGWAVGTRRAVTVARHLLVNGSVRGHSSSSDTDADAESPAADGPARLHDSHGRHVGKPGSETSLVSTPTTILSPEVSLGLPVSRGPSSDPGGEGYSSFEYDNYHYTPYIIRSVEDVPLDLKADLACIIPKTNVQVGNFTLIYDNYSNSNLGY